METSGGAPITPTAPVEQAEVMPSNMTGEQAKAWVETQKLKKSTNEKNIGAPEKKQGAKDPYLAEPKKEAVTTETVKEAAIEAKRKLKIDDQEIDEDEVIKTYRERKGHQQAANKALQEGKALRRQAEEFVALLRDPDKVFDVLTKLGHDPRTLSEKKIVAVLEEEMLTPEQRQQRERDRELAQFKAADKARLEEAKNSQHQKLKEQFAQDYTKQFTEALAASNLPATGDTVARMANYIARAAEINFKMTASEAAQLVREDIRNAQLRLIGDTDGEMLIQLLGEDVANKIRKWDTGRLKSPEQPRVLPENQGVPRDKRAPHKRMTSKEWREFNRR